MDIIVMPELKPVAEILISKLKEIKESGSGDLPLKDIIRLVPNFPIDNLEEELTERGALVFAKENFKNSGDRKQIEFDYDGNRYRIVIPETVKGKFYYENNKYKLVFDHNYKIEIGLKKIFWFDLKLEKVEIGEEEIFVDLEGDWKDTLIKFQD